MARYISTTLIIVLLIISCAKQEKHDDLPKNRLQKEKVFFKKAYNFMKVNQLDSAYYYYYKTINTANADSLIVSKSYLNLANIDYYKYNLQACEFNAIQALRYLNEKNTVQKANAYNYLALTAKAKRNYNEAIQYFNRFNQLEQKDSLRKFITYNNNMGNVYKEKKDYGQAIKYYDNILSINNLLKTNPKKYAKALDNKSWSQYLLTKERTALKDLLIAYKIRAKIHDNSGLVTSDLHLAKFYFDNHEVKKAEKYANDAKYLSKKYKYPYNLLESIGLLIKIKPKQAQTLHRSYEKIQDSIIHNERKYKEQTARIRFESVEKEKQLLISENELALKSKTNFWLKLVLITIFITFLFFLYLFRQISKKNKLLQEQSEKLLSKNNYIELIHREMHHRIKDNFLIVIHFINKLSAELSDENLINKLHALKNRILSLSKIHSALKDKTVQREINIHDYIDKIINDLHVVDDANIQIINNIDRKLSIPFKKIIPLALIINEFISNSFEHAFSDGQAGIINISLHKKDASFILEMKDNGKGLPDNFDLKSLKSHGLKIIYELATELNGKIERINDSGLKIVLIIDEKSVYN